MDDKDIWRLIHLLSEGETMKRNIIIMLFTIALMLGTAGCLSVPEGSTALRQRSLTFTPPQGKAAVYVILPQRFGGSAVLTPISLDYQEFGLLEGGSYLYGAVSPGEHVIFASQAGGNGATFTAEAGKNYFFEIKPGITSPRFLLVSEEEGEHQVQIVKLSGRNRFELPENNK